MGIWCACNGYIVDMWWKYGGRVVREFGGHMLGIVGICWSCGAFGDIWWSCSEHVVDIRCSCGEGIW